MSVARTYVHCPLVVAVLRVLAVWVSRRSATDAREEGACEESDDQSDGDLAGDRREDDACDGGDADQNEQHPEQHAVAVDGRAGVNRPNGPRRPDEDPYLRQSSDRPSVV